ncbi:hypothetical protein OAT42_04420 [Alphaproteobacteria bacterium]|nr:hypothetical protein [Alphaproteobacteria bacterium]
MLHKSFMIICVLLLISCNESNIKKLEVLNKEVNYSEKQFSLKWNLEKNIITHIPQKIKNRLKNICKNFDKYTLVKIETFSDDSVLGTFDCRI